MRVRMTTTALLRIAAVISLLFAGGHTLGGLDSWSPAGETEVLTAMRTVRFDTGGVSRTYLDFYLGFGSLLTVFLLLQAVLLWQMASLASTDPSRVRPMIVTFLVASIISTVLTWQFIFPVPVAFWVAIVVCLGFSLRAER